MNITLAHTQGGEVTGSIDESVRLLREMRSGKHPNGSMTLRAKIDLAPTGDLIVDKAVLENKPGKRENEASSLYTISYRSSDKGQALKVVRTLVDALVEDALKALDRHHVIYEAEFKLSHFEVNYLAIDAPRSLNHPLNVLYVSLDHIVSKLFPACHQIICLGNETPQI